ncbi:MAG: enoyl-CoA hydratase/isomerase family protein [Magnetococcales bacterium]|nr:enoyl-CoA hydratase/isomerase family protein [Magnetococcales bacterium]
MDSQFFTGRHWNARFEGETVVWLNADYANGSANVLSGEVLAELDEALEAIIARQPAALVIQSAKKSGFIAGADVKEFVTLENEEQARLAIRRALPIFHKLDTLPFPSVALIRGFCLGGGLELALCCRYRVAVDDPATRLGLPEVKLGIHPGFGGTVRLPRLIGPLPALDLILTGRTLHAKAALKLGLVDIVTAPRYAEQAVNRLLVNPPAPKTPSRLHRLANSWPVRHLLTPWLRGQTAKRVRQAHYPAPFAVLDLWRRGGDTQGMLVEEADSVARLMVGETSGNLVHLFGLRDRMKGLGRESPFDPKAVHVIGAGVMGGDIAAWCALQGLRVTLQDQNLPAVARAVARAAGLFTAKLREPRLVRDALDRLIPDPHGDGVAKADVVIEAIFENLQAKQNLCKNLEPRMKPGALLATNTSSIPLEEIASVLERPERFLGLHFFNPVACMELLEVVHGRHTSPEVVAAGCRFGQRINRLPLPVKSSPGFLVNRVLMPYLLEAFLLVAEGAPPPVVDAMALQFGMPMGPLELADTVGLDICLSVANNFEKHSGERHLPQYLRDMVAAGHLGRKSGQGFYRYQGKQKKECRVAFPGTPPEEMEDRLFLALCNEAVACLREGLVEDADLLDAGVVFGTGFAPFRGGPMRYLANRGPEPACRVLEKLHQKYGQRFQPDPGWADAQLLERLPQWEVRHEKGNPGYHGPLAGLCPR